MGLPLDTLAGTPFGSFLIPALLLALVVGGSALIAAVAHARKAPAAPRVSQGAALVLLGFLIVEVILLGFHWLQGFYIIVGLAQLLVAWMALATRGADLELPARQRAEAFLGRGHVAFVGLSRRPAEFSRSIAKEMVAQGIDVLGVNPAVEEPEVDGVPFVQTLASTEPAMRPRAAFILVSAERALEAVSDCIAAGVEVVWFHQGAGPASHTPEAVSRARQAGLEVITGLCPFMILRPDHWMHRMHRGMRFTTLRAA